MPGARDLLKPLPLDTGTSDLPAIMLGELVDISPVSVTVASIDGGRTAYAAFGTPPAGAAAGDPVRVALDELNRVVVVAW